MSVSSFCATSVRVVREAEAFSSAAVHAHAAVFSMLFTAAAGCTAKLLFQLCSFCLICLLQLVRQTKHCSLSCLMGCTAKTIVHVDLLHVRCFVLPQPDLGATAFPVMLPYLVHQPMWFVWLTSQVVPWHTASISAVMIHSFVLFRSTTNPTCSVVVGRKKQLVHYCAVGVYRMPGLTP